MSSDDGDNPPILERNTQRPARTVDSILLEALMYVLIEKGVLTKNDALSVVESAAQVKGGERDDDGGVSAQAAADLTLLRRMYVSFEALDDRPSAVNFDGQNVTRLRPPVHGDRPEFPQVD